LCMHREHAHEKGGVASSFGDGRWHNLSI
jgi:hypothetical protein